MVHYSGMPYRSISLQLFQGRGASYLRRGRRPPASGNHCAHAAGAIFQRTWGLVFTVFGVR